MKKEHFDAWMAYLEKPCNQSLQFKGALEVLTEDRGKCNCCLGVAANVCGVPKSREAALNNVFALYTFGHLSGTHSTSSPPPGWQGITDKYAGYLIDMNDSMGMSFFQIAAAIRASSAVKIDGVVFYSEQLKSILEYLKRMVTVKEPPTDVEKP